MALSRASRSPLELRLTVLSLTIVPAAGESGNWKRGPQMPAVAATNGGGGGRRAAGGGECTRIGGGDRYDSGPNIAGGGGLCGGGWRGGGLGWGG